MITPSINLITDSCDWIDFTKHNCIWKSSVAYALSLYLKQHQQCAASDSSLMKAFAHDNNHLLSWTQRCWTLSDNLDSFVIFLFSLLEIFMVLNMELWSFNHNSIPYYQFVFWTHDLFLRSTNSFPRCSFVFPITLSLAVLHENPITISHPVASFQFVSNHHSTLVVFRNERGAKPCSYSPFETKKCSNKYTKSMSKLHQM